MKRQLILFSVLAIGLIGGGFALTQTKKDTTPPVAETPTKIAEPAEQLASEYAAAFNKGDAEALLALWADDGELIQEDGTTIQGRKDIGELLKEVCKPKSGTIMKITVLKTKMAGPSAILFDGRVELTTSESKETAFYEGVIVQNAESKKWQISRIRDIPSEDASEYAKAYEELKQLEWLIGNWTAKEGDQTLSLNARWMKNRAYIIVDQTIMNKDQEVLSISMMIGHDVDTDVIHSWVFDTQGGRGEADWIRDGNTWNLEAVGLTGDGLAASSKPSWKFIDDRTFEWSSTARQVDGQPRPDIKLTYTKAAK